jgi:hypothetical protein
VTIWSFNDRRNCNRSSNSKKKNWSRSCLEDTNLFLIWVLIWLFHFRFTLFFRCRLQRLLHLRQRYT